MIHINDSDKKGTQSQVCMMNKNMKYMSDSFGRKNAYKKREPYLFYHTGAINPFSLKLFSIEPLSLV